MQAIPEIGDHTVKKQKREIYTPVPDSILTGAAAAGLTGNTVVNGLETPGGATTSLTEIGEGRKKVRARPPGHDQGRPSALCMELAIVDPAWAGDAAACCALGQTAPTCRCRWWTSACRAWRTR